MTAYRLTSLPGWVRKAHRPSNWTRYHSFYQQATQRPSNLVEFTERFRRDSYPAARRGGSSWMDGFPQQEPPTHPRRAQSQMAHRSVWLKWFQLDMSQYPSQLVESAVFLLSGLLWVASVPIGLVTRNAILVGFCMGAVFMALIYRNQRIRRSTMRADWALYNIVLAATAAGCDRVELPDDLDTFVAHAQMYIGATPDHAVTFGTIYRDAQDQPGLSPDN